VAALDRQKHRDLAAPSRSASISAAVVACSISSWCASKHRLHRIPQIQRPAYRLRTRKIDGNPQREERRVRSALTQPWNIHVTYVPPFAQVFSHHQYALNRVDVTVDSDRLRGQLARP
jgi:hypothetical protein